MTEFESSAPIVKKGTWPPVVDMTSLVGIGDRNYPIGFGNYCSIAGGPYLCNLWAENLKEWARRNPDSGPIEVTEFSHAGRSIGLVTDERLKAWCHPDPCVTGIGWPSVGVMRVVCEAMGASTVDRACGCERDDESPQVGESWRQVAGSPRRDHTFTCHRCKRQWAKTPKTPTA